MSSLHICEEQLCNAWRTLELQWKATCDLWNDPIRRQFEREVWDEFMRHVPRAIKALEELEIVISEVENHIY